MAYTEQGMLSGFSQSFLDALSKTYQLRQQRKYEEEQAKAKEQNDYQTKLKLLGAEQTLKGVEGGTLGATLPEKSVQLQPLQSKLDISMPTQRLGSLPERKEIISPELSGTSAVFEAYKTGREPELQTIQQTKMIKPEGNVYLQQGNLFKNMATGQITSGEKITVKDKIIPAEKMTVDTKNAITAAQNQLQNLNAIKSKVGKLPSDWLGGVFLPFIASATGGRVASDVKQYEDLKPAYSAGLYRALTGDTRLSDADAAARALPLLPNTSDSDEVKKGKMNFIENTLNNRIKMLNSGQFMLGETGELITPLNEQSNNESISDEELIQAFKQAFGK